MSRATNEALDALHALQAEALVAELKAAKERKDENGNPVPIPAALLNAVTKFLKDNGIDAPASARRFDSIVDQLRDMDPDEIAAARPN